MRMSIEERYLRSQAYLENLPDEMKERAQWLCYSVVNSKNADGTWKSTKMPFSPIAKTSKGWNRKENWGTFDQALDEFASNENLSGLSFIVTKEDPYVAIDLDGCVKDGQLSETAKEFIVATAGSYTELSRSKKGIHIFVKDDIAKNFNFQGVEMYNDNKPIALTAISSSRHFIKSDTVEQRDVSVLYSKYAPKHTSTYVPKVYDDISLGEVPSESVIIETIQKHAPKTWELFQYGGKTGDGSRDDFTMMLHLNKFAHGNIGTMVSLFKQSACARPVGTKRNTEAEYDKYLAETAERASRVATSSFWDYSLKTRLQKEFHFNDRVSEKEINEYYANKTSSRKSAQKLPDQESIIGRMMRSKPEVSEIYFGKSNGNSRSNDWKLITELSYYCCADEEMMKKLFSRSAVYKNFDNELKQKQYNYYIDKTIDKVANRQENVYQWERKKENKHYEASKQEAQEERER